MPPDSLLTFCASGVSSNSKEPTSSTRNACISATANFHPMQDLERNIAKVGVNFSGDTNRVTHRTPARKVMLVIVAHGMEDQSGD